MTLSTFIKKFKRCPFCQKTLTITAKQKVELQEPNQFRVVRINNVLIINVSSQCFVDKRQGNFDFSISIKDGHILHTDAANQFISLYDLDMILTKECHNENQHWFKQSIRLHYDRSQSSFIAENWKELFRITRDKDQYCFVNNFHLRKSFLSHQNQIAIEPNLVYTQYIPFDKFHLEDEEKMLAKINTIKLLT